MEEFNKKLRERWQQKRKKASNWTGLLIKVLILFALLSIISHISKSKNIDWSRIKTKPDTIQAVPDSIKG